MDMGSVEVWLPKGRWFDFFTGLLYASRRGRKLSVSRKTAEMPVFAKAGAIVPMANYPDHENVLYNCGDMTVLVFPGSSNSFALYEDAGTGNDYAAGAFAQTEMTLQWSDAPVFTISPAAGDRTLIPAQRTWRIGLRGFHKEIAATVQVDGNAVPAQFNWDRETGTLWVSVTAATCSEVKLCIDGEKLITDNPDVIERIRDLVLRAQCSMFEKEAVMKCVLNAKSDLWTKYLQLSGEIMAGSLADAVFELLSLTEDPYTGAEQ
jgi:hypothetical protein